jgi:hypothetical protein
LLLGCILGDDGHQRHELCSPQPHEGDTVSNDW